MTNGGSLERLGEEGEADSFDLPDAKVNMNSTIGEDETPNGTNGDGHSRRHNGHREGNPSKDAYSDSSDSENCCRNLSLDKLLNSVGDSLGLEPIPSRYKPVSARHSAHSSRSHQQPQPQAHEPVHKHGRSNSDPPIDSHANKYTHENSLPTPIVGPDAPPSPPGMRRRRRTSTSRRQSINLALRGHVGTANGGGRAPPSMPQSRGSFELKQNALYSMQTDGTLEHLCALENMKVEEQWQSKQSLWRRLAIRASPPDTSQKELIQRSTFILLSTSCVGCGVIWGLMYVALGEWLAALMPFVYSTSMSFILFTCVCNSKSTKGYETFVTWQLLLILALPFAVHVALGGVDKSGGVMLWSFLCPMGAAFFRSAKESVRWYWLYMGISVALLVKGFWDVEDGNEEQFFDVEGNAIVGRSAAAAAIVQQLYFLMNIIGVFCVIFAAVYLFACDLEKEYTKSEEVLLNILPSSIVKRIKRGEFPIVDHVAGVTILFADLVGFTKASTELHPNFLIGLFLRDIFQAFDELVYKHGLEKIKTIGDAYMVVGGLNHGEKLSQESRAQSAEYEGQKPQATNIMFLAVDMFKALQKVNDKYNLQFDLRIGVHTGPVVAGVLGLKRFTYDVWGDSVNVSFSFQEVIPSTQRSLVSSLLSYVTLFHHIFSDLKTASRMESNGVAGLIHMSSDMYESVGAMTSVFDFTCCGKLDIKGKGEMTTYLATPLV